MKIKNVITLTALSAMILSGCGSTSKEASSFDEYKPAPPNEEIELPESVFKGVAAYFSEWELPTENILPEDHEYYVRLENVVIYDNGYAFDKDTKKMESRISTKETNYATPVATPDQFGGIAMALLSTIVGDLKVMGLPDKPDNAEHAAYYVESLSNNSAVITRQFNEIVKYASHEDLLKFSKEVLNDAKKIQQQAKEIGGDINLEDVSDLETRYKEMQYTINELSKAAGGSTF